MPAGADLLEIGAASLAAAHCGAQRIEVTPDGAGRLSTSPTTGHTHVGAEVRPTAEATGAPGSNIGSSHKHSAETGAAHPGYGAFTARTTQSIPRAIPRHVLARDHHTCRIPGCRNSCGVEVHHVVPRAEGGSNRPENLSGICTVHHPAIHAGQILVSGTAENLDVRHADGTPYGGAVSAPRSDTSEKGLSEACAGWATRNATRVPPSRRLCVMLARPVALPTTQRCSGVPCRTWLSRAAGSHSSLALANLMHGEL